jgi:hypothetical protein
MGSFSIWHWVVVLMMFGPALLGIFVFKQKPITVKHKDSGIRKTARLGWCWTYYYFGFIVPIIRGEIGIAVLHFILSVVTLGLFQFIWSFFYNKQHITRLMTSGWMLDDTPEVEKFAREKLRMS